MRRVFERTVTAAVSGTRGSLARASRLAAAWVILGLAVVSPAYVSIIHAQPASGQPDYGQAPSAATPAPEATDPAQAPAPAAPPTPGASQTVDAAVRTTLSRFGSFRSVINYGEVWIPTVTPPDWRPYAACHWVNTRTLGWYYDDRTPWGAIIHHYGRWAHDASLGWFWVPGRDFSPGWVSWRSSPDYIGWAPLPPNGNLDVETTAAFDNGGFWTFMETAVFDRGCGGGAILPQTRTTAVLGQTQPVTDIAFARGVWIAVLPTYVVGPVVDVAVDFKPWSGNTVLVVLTKWNTAWNTVKVKTTINVVDCKPKKPKPPPHTPRKPPPPKRCAGSYVQPDGTCGTLTPRPPPQCVAGYTNNASGACVPQQQSYNAVPVPPLQPSPPGQLQPTPPVIVPPPVPPPPVIIPPPGGGGQVSQRCRPDSIRGPDGRCHRPGTPGPGTSATIGAQPSAPGTSGAVGGRPPPTIVGKLPRPQTSAGGAPVISSGCDLMRGAAKRRCRDGQNAGGQGQGGGYTTTTVEAQGTAAAAPPRPSPGRGLVRRPPHIAVGSPTFTSRPSRPSLVAPAQFRPRRPVAARPVMARRPAPRRPTFRPAGRPSPAARAAFRPARSQFRPRVSRPVSRPVPRVSRPVFRSAPRVSAPRRGGGGGGGRRRR